MISYLRRVFVESWLGRVTAIVVFVAFVGWGVGDVIGYMSDETDTVARVGQHRIASAELASALRAEMPGVVKQMGVADPSQLSPVMRRQVALQILHRLTGQNELLEAATAMNVVVPDEAVRDEIFALPYFKGANGQFDRSIFNQRLREQGLTEQRVVQIVRDDLTSRALLQPLALSGSMSSTMLQRLVAYGARTHAVDFVRVPFAAQPTPDAPDDAVLRRFYVNHPWLFRSPELRHARIVVLSPATVADTITLDDQRLKRVYDEQNARYNVPETRDIQLITFPDQAQAQSVSTSWQHDGNWQAAQAAAKGAAAVEMPGMRPSAIPSEALRTAVFQAPVDQVSTPLKTEAGWAVFRVTKVTPARITPFEEARKDILAEYRKAVAPSVVAERQRQLQDAIAAKGLNAIPDTLGAVAAAGTLDAKGLTATGEPAPLPASGALRDAVVRQVFAQKQGANPTLTEGPDNSWFAVDVDNITPSQPIAFEQARASVLAAWQAESRRRVANQRATGLYVATKAKGSLDASALPEAQVTRDATFSLALPNKTIPTELMAFLGRMKAGQAVMAEDDSGFLVAVVTRVFTPDPPAPAQALQKLRQDLAQADGEDIVASYIQALSTRVPPHINEAGLSAALSAAGFGETTP
ncbi:peptidyl-prolyl cis-trans isomerase [Acetobacter sp. TBRC 12305]|uniref:Parvulin-like PPIase n=1 Tax=Acetobacter garciniae TaxID=2817435 RepID=A0A939HIT3_9PROT|nr:peptidyl-prolyl cis-trans isomerase [Acetobacter garciniae]MBO1324212.1 peptidyl-prolyl cis-trans isomerase [Acetobacter garciniae]MBX0343901.1 peptidyl-prolyl cis-trans isomerase [Acetobacter garciniae]